MLFVTLRIFSYDYMTTYNNFVRYVTHNNNLVNFLYLKIFIFDKFKDNLKLKKNIF